MSNLRRILPLLLCLLCACVQMPNAPKDETPLQSPLPTATAESSAAPAPTATPEPTMVPAMATAHDNATRTAPVIEDPAVWDDNAEQVLSALEKQFASYGMTLTAKEGYPYLLAVNNAGGTVTVYTVDAATGRYAVPFMAMVCSGGADTPTGYFSTPVDYSWRLLMRVAYWP